MTGEQEYEFTLWVNGASHLSAQAIANMRAFCDAHLPGRSHLEVLDVREHADLALRHRVLASPTLIKEKPLPIRMLVGDLSDENRVLTELDIPPFAIG
jgi:circadian clock protein KaiB